MLKLPLVSVVVTNYNYAEYIKDCLESISKQTYKHVECIIIDDKSSDNSIEIIKQFIKDQSSNNEISFRLLQQEKNSGQLSGFMLGIKEAQGTFISFIDADDIIFPDFINIHVQVHFSTNVSLTCSRNIEIDENSAVQSYFSLISDETKLQSCFTVKFQEVKTLFNELESQRICNFSDEISCKIIDVMTHPIGGWYWYPTSNAMFRKKTLELLYMGNSENWKICADKILFSFAHLIGKSCLFDRYLTGYRHHSKNGFASHIFGGSSYMKNETHELCIKMDEYFFTDIINIFLTNKDCICERIGLVNYIQLIKTIVYSNSIKNVFKNLKKIKVATGVNSSWKTVMFSVKYIIRRVQYKWKNAGIGFK